MFENSVGVIRMFGLSLPLNEKSEMIRKLFGDYFWIYFYFKINLCILTKKNNNKLLYYM